jgi:hypothetical protein
LVGAIEEGKDAMVMVNGHGTYDLERIGEDLILDLRPYCVASDAFQRKPDRTTGIPNKNSLGAKYARV